MSVAQEVHGHYPGSHMHITPTSSCSKTAYGREIYHWALLHLMLFRTTIETMRPWPIRLEHKTKQKSKDFHNVNDNRKANECILEASGVPGQQKARRTISAIVEHSNVSYTQLLNSTL